VEWIRTNVRLRYAKRQLFWLAHMAQFFRLCVPAKYLHFDLAEPGEYGQKTLIISPTHIRILIG
jgi:hypothetical protein